MTQSTERERDTEKKALVPVETGRVTLERPFWWCFNPSRAINHRRLLTWQSDRTVDSDAFLFLATGIARDARELHLCAPRQQILTSLLKSLSDCVLVPFLIRPYSHQARGINALQFLSISPFGFSHFTTNKYIITVIKYIYIITVFIIKDFPILAVKICTEKHN